MIAPDEALIPLIDALEKVTGRKFSRQTIHRWRIDGRLKCTKIGSRWLTTIKNVKSMIEKENPNGD